MRPVHLSIEGLACFKEKQELDFRKLDLFAISGPTGAGKSTLLDAIIFALYGEVPRVNNHNRSEMISAARDRVSVVLDFDIGTDRYRIARTLRRNGNHSVQLDKHDGQSFATNLADQVRSAADRVNQILGLEAPAFMQAVILPQGEFAKFLKAQPRDRRNMLRTLLKLDVYERMREQAQRLSTARKGTVESLQRVLSDEYIGVDELAVSKLETEHTTVAESLETLRMKRDKAQTTLVRLRGQHSKTIELRDAEEKQVTLEKLTDELNPVKLKIEWAALAKPLVALLDEARSALSAADMAQKAADKAKADHEATLNVCEKRAAVLESAEKAAEAISSLREQVARLNVVVGRLPERDQLEATITRQTQDISGLVDEISFLAKMIESAKVIQTQQQEAVDAACRAVEASEYDPEFDAMLENVRDPAVKLGAARKNATEAGNEVDRRCKAIEILVGEVESLRYVTECARISADETQRTFQSAKTATLAIIGMREQIARLNQVIGRLPEQEQLEARIARLTQEIKALDDELPSLRSESEVAIASQTEQEAGVDAARQAVQASEYDAEVDALLESVRDQAIKLAAARRHSTETGTEVERKRKAVEDIVGEIEPLKRNVESARISFDEARRAVQGAAEALHRAHRLDEANHLRESLEAGQPCPVCEQFVATPPAASISPEFEATKAALDVAQEKSRMAETSTKRHEAALTREEARLDAARQSLAELESRYSELQISVSLGDEETRRTLGIRAPRGNVVVEAWIETQVGSLARSRKANERARAELGTAERALEMVKAEAVAALGRIGEKEMSRNHLEEDRESTQQRLTSLQEEIKAVTDSVDPVAEAAAISEQIKELDANFETAAEKATTSQTQLLTAEEVLRLKVEACEAQQQSLRELESRHSILQRGVSESETLIRRIVGARAPQDDVVVEEWIEAQVAVLAKSRKESERAKSQLSTAARQLEKAKAEETAARGRIDEKEASRNRSEQERVASQKRLLTLQDEIRAVTESADPAAEAATLSDQIQQLDSNLNTATDEAAISQNQLMTTSEALRLRAEAADAALQNAIQRSEKRNSEIARAGFKSEAAVKWAILDDTTVTKLKEQVHKHEQESHAVEERIITLKTELGDERVSDEQLESVATFVADLTIKVETEVGEGTKLEEQIRRMKQRLESSRKLRDQLDTEEKAMRLYNHLAGDLRSDKFQAYVLEEVFTELVHGASARLLSLTGERYALQFNAGEIVVVDNDNAGETRISDTLSGGETFLASLSLALELSDQVQRAAGAVNLDSLFIDEGFGTLDPDTLALVSETIQSLRVGGRMVGIITHIPELRDEFAQQVIVTKHQGFSTVEVSGLADITDSIRR